MDSSIAQAAGVTLSQHWQGPRKDRANAWTPVVAAGNDRGSLEPVCPLTDHLMSCWASPPLLTRPTSIGGAGLFNDDSTAKQLSMDDMVPVEVKDSVDTMT